MKNLSYILIFLLFACTDKQRHQAIISNVDKIKVVNLLHDTTFIYSDTRDIDNLKEIINARHDNISSKRIYAEIQYYEKERCVLTAKETETGCFYIIKSDTFKSKITWMQGQIIGGS